MAGYRLTDPTLRERYQELSASKTLDSLKQELLLMRTIVEDRLNLAKNDAERIVVYQTIVPQITAIDKLYNSLLKLELSYSQVLEKSAAEALAMDIVKIIAEELEDIPGRDTVIDKISARIAQAFVDARNPDA